MIGRRLLTLLLVASVSLVGCRRSPAKTTGSELTIAARADVTGIFPNPPYQAEVFSIDVNANIFDSLVRFDQDLNVRPGLAERWENPDDLSWVFRLRNGATFSDGTPVSARDVVASLRTTITRNTPLLSQDTVEEKGDDRVVIRTRRFTPHLLARLQSAFVLPAAALAASPVPAIGSGPYALESWTPGSELVLVRNPRFHGPAPAFERVRLRVMPSARERVDALLAGEAQIADVIPPELIAPLEREPGLRVVSEPSLRVLFLGFRVDRPPFSDIRVRRAFRLALDKKELIRVALAGQGWPATQLIPPQVFGYDPGIPESVPDVAEARRLLAEAGYRNGLDVRFDGPSDRYVNDLQMYEELRRQLGTAGARVTVQAMPKNRYFSHLATGESSLFILGWACSTLFGGDALEALVHSRRGDQGLFNYQGIRDPELDRLTEESLRNPNSRERLEAIREAMALVARQELLVPLLVSREAIAFSRRIDWEPEKGLALRLSDMRPASRKR